MNTTQKQITIQNISENIIHIISLLDQNATTMPSPEIAKETCKKNDAVKISPHKDYGLGMHSKNISRCQTEELGDSDSALRNLETFQQSKKQFKKKIRNEEEVENKGFNIDGDMSKFLEHLDHHTKDLFQSTKEVLDENLPIIYNSLATVKSFISFLGKIIKRILHEIDPISGEITLKCKGCLLHCPQNWSLTSPPG